MMDEVLKRIGHVQGASDWWREWAIILMSSCSVMEPFMIMKVRNLVLLIFKINFFIDNQLDSKAFSVTNHFQITSKRSAVSSVKETIQPSPISRFQRWFK